jgi:hypothetical protein
MRSSCIVNDEIAGSGFLLLSAAAGGTVKKSKIRNYTVVLVTHCHDVLQCEDSLCPAGPRQGTRINLVFMLQVLFGSSQTSIRVQLITCCCMLMRAGSKPLRRQLQLLHSRRLRQLLPTAASLQAAWAASVAHLQYQPWTLQLPQQQVAVASRPPGLVRQLSAVRRPAELPCVPVQQQVAALAGASSQQHLCGDAKWICWHPSYTVSCCMLCRIDHPGLVRAAVWPVMCVIHCSASNGVACYCAFFTQCCMPAMLWLSLKMVRVTFTCC